MSVCDLTTPSLSQSMGLRNDAKYLGDITVTSLEIRGTD